MTNKQQNFQRFLHILPELHKGWKYSRDVLIQSTNVTDRRTDRHWATAKTRLRIWSRAVKSSYY